MSYISRLSRFIPELKAIKPEQLKLLEDQFSKIFNKFDQKIKTVESQIEKTSEELKKINDQYKDSLKKKLKDFMNKNFSQEILSNESREKIIEKFEKFYDTASKTAVKKIQNTGIKKIGKAELETIYGLENESSTKNNGYSKIKKNNILSENQEKRENNTVKSTFQPIEIKEEKQLKGSELIYRGKQANYIEKYGTKPIKFDMNELKKAGFPSKSVGNIER